MNIPLAFTQKSVAKVSSMALINGCESGGLGRLWVGLHF